MYIELLSACISIIKRVRFNWSVKKWSRNGGGDRIRKVKVGVESEEVIFYTHYYLQITINV